VAVRIVAGVHIRGGEPVHLAAVPLVVGAVPGVIEIGDLTVLGTYETPGSGDPTDSSGPDWRRWVARVAPRAALVVQLTEVVVEGPVFLHQHHDGVDRNLVAVRPAAPQRLCRQRAGVEATHRPCRCDGKEAARKSRAYLIMIASFDVLTDGLRR